MTMPNLRFQAPSALFALALALPLVLAGCSQGSAGNPDSAAAMRQQQSREAAARKQLEQIPPPSKSLYLSVNSKGAYANPFLVVHPNMLTLTVIFPDQTPHAFGTGGFLRPASARRRDVDIRLSDLTEALTALPPEVWPYGRVVAVEEPSGVPKDDRIAIRRNVEATVKILNDLGIVVDEWGSVNGTPQR